ncbi:MAG: hypothetical protein ACSLE0_05680, partial [Chitinophagaceae bacterium]
YASDVLAGFIIGVLWLLISLSVLNKLEQYAKDNAETLDSVSGHTNFTSPGKALMVPLPVFERDKLPIHNWLLK